MKMKYSVKSILIALHVLCYSCANYSKEQDIPFDQLNDSIRIAASKAEAWISSPETISKHLFPAAATPEGNRSYAVRIDCPGGASCEVTVTDEGPIDDEVYGQKWKATFVQTGRGWQLSKLAHSLKRRF